MCLENNKTIEELYCFYEDELHASTDKNKELTDKMLKIEEPFYDSLTEKQKLQFEQIMELEAENDCVTDERIFTFAFKLATKLILEGMN